MAPPTASASSAESTATTYSPEPPDGDPEDSESTIRWNDGVILNGGTSFASATPLPDVLVLDGSVDSSLQRASSILQLRLGKNYDYFKALHPQHDPRLVLQMLNGGVDVFEFYTAHEWAIAVLQGESDWRGYAGSFLKTVPVNAWFALHRAWIAHDDRGVLAVMQWISATQNDAVLAVYNTEEAAAAYVVIAQAVGFVAATRLVMILRENDIVAVATLEVLAETLAKLDDVEKTEFEGEHLTQSLHRVVLLAREERIPLYRVWRLLDFWEVGDYERECFLTAFDLYSGPGLTLVADDIEAAVDFLMTVDSFDLSALLLADQVRRDADLPHTDFLLLYETALAITRFPGLTWRQSVRVLQLAGRRSHSEVAVTGFARGFVQAYARGLDGYLHVMGRSPDSQGTSLDAANLAEFAAILNVHELDGVPTVVLQTGLEPFHDWQLDGQAIADAFSQIGYTGAIPETWPATIDDWLRRHDLAEALQYLQTARRMIFGSAEGGNPAQRVQDALAVATLAMILQTGQRVSGNNAAAVADLPQAFLDSLPPTEAVALDVGEEIPLYPSPVTAVLPQATQALRSVAAERSAAISPAEISVPTAAAVRR